MWEKRCSGSCETTGYLFWFVWTFKATDRPEFDKEDPMAGQIRSGQTPSRVDRDRSDVKSEPILHTGTAIRVNRLQIRRLCVYVCLSRLYVCPWICICICMIYTICQTAAPEPTLPSFSELQHAGSYVT